MKIVKHGDNDFVHNFGTECHSASTESPSEVFTSGTMTHAVSTGKRSMTETWGEHSHACATGDESWVATKGSMSIACGLGYRARVQAEDGWLVIADWRGALDNKRLHAVYAVQVGGTLCGIEVDPWHSYCFIDGLLTECEDIVSDDWQG